MTDPWLMKRGMVEVELAIGLDRFLKMRPDLLGITTPGSLQLYVVDFLQQLKRFAGDNPVTLAIAREHARTQQAKALAQKSQEQLYERLQNAMQYGCLTADAIAEVFNISSHCVKNWSNHGIPRLDATDYPAKTKKPVTYSLESTLAGITWFGPGT